MSLDVYLTMRGIQVTCSEPEIYIRENGTNRKISRQEWNERFPDREPYTLTPLDDSERVYERNITHNLNRMAGEAGIYEHLWRPDEIGITHARQLIAPLQAGLEILKAQPARFQQFNPPNGWGDYEGLVEFVQSYLSACREWPDAEVSVSR